MSGVAWALVLAIILVAIASFIAITRADEVTIQIPPLVIVARRA